VLASTRPRFYAGNFRSKARADGAVGTLVRDQTAQPRPVRAPRTWSCLARPRHLAEQPRLAASAFADCSTRTLVYSRRRLRTSWPASDVRCAVGSLGAPATRCCSVRLGTA
jgi:hypothetical protein